MESFTRVDIFDTKGIEYLFLIAYLVLLIFIFRLWEYPLSRGRNIVYSVKNFHAEAGKILKGLIYHTNHTWTFRTPEGSVLTGINAFVANAVDQLEIVFIKSPGEKISRGEVFARIGQEPGVLKIRSAVTGTILQINEDIVRHPGRILEDIYNTGWLIALKPESWKEEASTGLTGEESEKWINNELERVRSFTQTALSGEQTQVFLQDGGTLATGFLSRFPENVWLQFDAEFMTL